jgi:hypothetical protein
MENNKTNPRRDTLLEFMIGHCGPDLEMKKDLEQALLEGEQEDQQKEEEQQESQKKDQEQFDLLVDSLLSSYNPETVIEEDAVLTVAHAIWSKRGKREGGEEMMQADLKINTALSRLSRSKSLRKTGELRNRPTGIMGHIQRKGPRMIRTKAPQIVEHRQSGAPKVMPSAAESGKSSVGEIARVYAATSRYQLEASPADEPKCIVDYLDRLG